MKNHTFQIPSPHRMMKPRIPCKLLPILPRPPHTVAYHLLAPPFLCPQREPFRKVYQHLHPLLRRTSAFVVPYFKERLEEGSCGSELGVASEVRYAGVEEGLSVAVFF